MTERRPDRAVIKGQFRDDEIITILRNMEAAWRRSDISEYHRLRRALNMKSPKVPRGRPKSAPGQTTAEQQVAHLERFGSIERTARTFNVQVTTVVRNLVKAKARRR